MINNRKLGKFLIRNAIINNTPETAKEILAGCIVVRAEQLYYLDAIEYVAISDAFDEMKAGSIVPTYDVAIEDGKVTFTKEGVK